MVEWGSTPLEGEEGVNARPECHSRRGRQVPPAFSSSVHPTLHEAARGRGLEHMLTRKREPAPRVGTNDPLGSP